ncbi:MAG: hypothetical protein ABSA53_19455 [Streptosporangiaceae bacterium]
MAGNTGSDPGDRRPGGGMYYDPEYRLWLPSASRDADRRAGKTLSVPAPEETASDRKSFRRTAVPRLLAAAICGGLASLILLLGGSILQKPQVESFAVVPVLFVDYVVSELDERRIALPAPLRDVLRNRLLAIAGYAALLVAADYIEGVLLQAAGGSVSALGLLNLGTGAAMGVLIGWRSPRHAVWTIAGVAYTASLLGAAADLGFLGSQRFRQIHAGASLTEVVIVSGTVFAVSGTLGYLGLRVKRHRAAHERGGGEDTPVRDARATGNQVKTRRNRISAGVLALLALTAVIAYALSSSGGAQLAPGSYPVNRQISSSHQLILTVTGVQVAKNGTATLFITYRNTGSSPESLTCGGYSERSAAAAVLSDGQVIYSEATYCSDHPGKERTVSPGRSVLSYAVFADASDLAHPFTFYWSAGILSGTIPQVSLTSRG